MALSKKSGSRIDKNLVAWLQEESDEFRELIVEVNSPPPKFSIERGPNGGLWPTTKLGVDEDLEASLTNSSVTSSIRFDVTIQALNSFFRCVTSTNGRKSYHPLIALRFKIAHWCS